jgi:hypothetical protein
MSHGFAEQSAKSMIASEKARAGNCTGFFFVP